MIPDKIYCGNNGNGNLSYSSQPFVDAKEYIRKDALLGWAKTKLSHLQEDFDVYTGQRLILRELIDKIESL